MAPHFAEGGVIITQVFESSLGDDAALVEDIDIIEMGQQVQTVDGGDDGFVGKGLEKALIDECFRTRVHAAGGFVEEDKGAVAGSEDAAGQGESLLLSAGEVDAFFADIRLEALRQLPDDLGEVGFFTYLQDLLFREGQAEGDIVFQGILEDLRFLGEEGNAFIDLLECAGMAVDADLESGLRVIEAAKQGKQGTLAAAAFADEGDALTAADSDIQVMQALGAAAGVVGGVIRKVEPADAEGLPIGWQTVGPVGAMVFGVRGADAGSRLDVGVVLDDIGVLPGDILEDTGKSIHVCQEGHQAADVEEFAGHPMLVDKPDGDQCIDSYDHHFGAEPFPFVDESAFTKRVEYRLDLGEQAGLHAAFEAEGDDGHDIGQAVEEGGRDDVFFFVDLVEGFDKGFVEGTDDEDGADAHDHGDGAIEGREIEDGDNGEQEFGEGIHVHKAVIEKVPKRLVGFPDPVDRRTAMVVLVPFYRQVEYLVVFFLEEVAAELEGQRTFHDTGGAVETPLGEFYGDVPRDIEQRVVPNVLGVLLQPADKPAEEDGVKRIDQIGADEHRIDEHILLLFVAGIAPGGAEE